ncbi:MAG TPA: hypothetical protein VFJ72_09020 [Rubrobacteraceae bacterium]|nr:hypothetical protein [Rubrobacteraceae bacterium]
MVANFISAKNTNLTALARSLGLYAAATLSMTAAGIHLWVAPEHLAEWWGYGAFFLITALVQGLFGVALLRWPGRRLFLAGAFGNLGIVAFYIITRTAGIPFIGPHAGEVHPAAALDLFSVAVEISLVATLVALADESRRARLYLALAAVQALAAGAALHSASFGTYEAFGLGSLTHWLQTSMLALPLAALALWVSTYLSRRISTFFFGTATGFSARLTWALTAAFAYALASVPADTLATQHAGAGTFAAQAGRDAGITLLAGFLVLFSIAALRGTPYEAPRTVSFWHPRALAAVAGLAAGAMVVAGPSLFGAFSAPAEAQAAPDCGAATADRSYDVAAINLDIPYNRWGDSDPNGQMYVLQGDKAAVKNWSKPLAADPSQDPAGNRRLRPRPLVIRANAGECVRVDFTNELTDGGDGLPTNPRASMKVFGAAYDAQTSDGSAVGYNDDTTVPNTPGQNKITYFWKAPNAEGLFMIRDQGATAGTEGDGGSVAHGLFGALAVEPAGSTWTDPVSGNPLYTGTANQSGSLYVDADIHPQGGKSFRESVQLAQDEIPHSIGFGFNYGSDQQRHREAPGNRAPDGIGEETSLSSWVAGDPAMIKLASGPGPWLPTPENTDPASVEDCGIGTPGFNSTSCYISNVTHTYVGDPSKIRFALAGVKETHVFHMHAHQWLAEPADTGDAPMDNITDANRPDSTTIDSQTFGPGESYTADLLFGSGSKKGTIGDSIFHCHLYPHFADGFWALFRTHDVLEDGKNSTPDGVNVRNLQPLPDRTPLPAATPDNPGYPRFIPGKFGWRAPQPINGISEARPDDPNTPDVDESQDDPTTVKREDLQQATRIVAGQALDPNLDPNDPNLTPAQKEVADKLAVEKNVQKLHYGDRTPRPGAPLTDPCPAGAREITYNVSVMQRDITYNEAGWHDTQGRFLVLDKDVPKMLEKNPDGTYKNQPEPLFFRANAGDCINYNLTNRLPNWLGDDAFTNLNQTNMFGEHIHLVKFDVLGSDGSSNGWNYQEAAFTQKQMNFNKDVMNGGPGAPSCNRTDGCRVPDPAPGTWNPQWSGDEPGQTIHERWYADYELRTVFTHDHHFAAVDQNRGLFGALIVEPKGMDFRDPKTGAFSQPINNPANGPVCGSGADPNACTATAAGAAVDVIGPGAKDDFREFGLGIQDFVSLTKKDGDPRVKADTINPPEAPEHFPDDDPGVMSVNYRNAPFVLRQTDKNGNPTDPAHVFSSTVHGDPQTPVLQAYSEDPVRIRLIQGSQEEQHVMTVNGMRWKEEPDDPESPFINARQLGVSEAFNFEVPKMTCGSTDQTCTGDYLYGSTGMDDMYSGMWGILRARGKQVPSLKPLPDNASPTEATVAGVPTSSPISSTSSAPPESNNPGTPCPAGAPVKKYEVVAMQKSLTYNKAGDNDPYGLIYVLASDEAAIKSGEKKPEPLVLRANEGDCIEVGLTNHLTPAWLQHGNAGTDGDAKAPTEPDAGTPAGLRVSLHPQLVKYDVRGSDGTAVGYNKDETVAPGDRKLYRWYADDVAPGELGATNLTDFGDARGHRHHGLFAGLNIEPKGATYHDPKTGDEIKSGVSADIRIPGPDNDFREFTTFFQDGLNLRDSSGVPIPDRPDHPPTPAEPLAGALDFEDQGEKGFNYGNAPFDHRLGYIPMANDSPDGAGMANVFSSSAHGDPDTPIFRAYAGDRVRMRVLQGEDKPREHSFQLSGHSWRAQPDDPGSTVIGTAGGMSVGRALNIDLPSVGGPSGTPGDYRYGCGVFFHHLSGGLWGIMRVYGQPSPAAALNPSAIGDVDDPYAGGHPLMPLDLAGIATSSNINAAPASLEPGQATTLSGTLSTANGPLAKRSVTLEQKPAGETAFTAVANGSLKTDADGNFSLADVKPAKTTEYRASFAGQPTTGLQPSVSASKQVIVMTGSAITANASAAIVNYGGTTAISGALTSDGAALPGKTVVLEQKPAGTAAFSAVAGATAQTGAGGSYTFAGVKPLKNTTYRVSFAGQPDAGLKATEAMVVVKVKAMIGLNVAATNLKLGNSRVISGSVAPAHAGVVKLTIKRNGAPVLANKSLSLKSSRYSFSYKPPRAGLYTVSVSFAGEADHLGGTSPVRSFKVIK